MSELFAGLVLLAVGAALGRRSARRGPWDKSPTYVALYRENPGEPLEEPPALVDLTPPPLELLERGGPWP